MRDDQSLVAFCEICGHSISNATTVYGGETTVYPCRHTTSDVWDRKEVCHFTVFTVWAPPMLSLFTALPTKG